MTDISALEAYAGTISEAAAKANAASQLQHAYINDSADKDVVTESGLVPTIAKQARLYLESIPDAVAELSAQMANGRIYDSFAAGRDATALNQYFWVTPAGSGLLRVAAFKKISATDQVFAFSYAEGTELDALYRKGVDEKVAFTFEDAYGFILAALTAAGTFNIKALDFGGGRLIEGIEGLEVNDSFGFNIARLGVTESSLSGMNVKRSNASSDIEIGDDAGFVAARFGIKQSMVNGLVIEPTLLPGIEITDEYGFVLARFDNNPPVTDVIESSGIVRWQIDAQQRTAIMHIIGYGQSLGRGINSIPAISLSQPYQNVMLASGVKVRASEAGYNPSSFVPLVEVTASVEGETPIAGLCNGLVRRAVSDGEAASDWVFLGSAPGRSGRAVEQLMPSSDPLADFNKMVRQVNDSKALADATGRSYSVWAYSWDQGESNYVGAYTRSAYLYTQYILSLFDALTAEVTKITGQAFRPFVFTYQVGAHRKYSVDNMSIALAQWRVSRQREDVVLAAPVYMFATGDDSLHLTNESSWLLGEYKSRAMHHTMIRRSGKWRPLEPVSVDWQTNHIDIRLHVPKGPLVLDAALCAAEINFGFDVRENDLVVDIISSVTIVGPDVVRLALTRAASVEAVLSYARGRSTGFAGSGPTQGARGNLRDSHGDFDKAVSPLGNTFSLHNTCVMFQYDRRTGF